MLSATCSTVDGSLSTVSKWFFHLVRSLSSVIIVLLWTTSSCTGWFTLGQNIALLHDDVINEVPVFGSKSFCGFICPSRYKYHQTNNCIGYRQSSSTVNCVYTILLLIYMISHWYWALFIYRYSKLYKVSYIWKWDENLVVPQHCTRPQSHHNNYSTVESFSRFF